MLGKTLAHYELTALLGKGGMGEVYRARDTRLKRDVALKILPDAMAADPERLKRFQHEAETVAGLSHPHIVHIYSVEEAAGVHFLTMELVDGEDLAQILTAGHLPLAKILEIGIGIADALTAAHERGIVHRDLKPANVVLTKDERVKVLDFGLAGFDRDATGGADPETLATQDGSITRAGHLMGTIPYMSPEQVRGVNVGYRSDIFSLGILLYELAAEDRPFVGDTRSDLISSILRDVPTPLTRLKPEIPPPLQAIVARCLEKDPAKRYQSARELRTSLEALRDGLLVESVGRSGTWTSGPVPELSALRPRARRRIRAVWIGLAVTLAGIAAFLVLENRVGPLPVPAAPEDQSIAVLPFVNMSSDKEQEYFSDGLSEELLNLLARIPELRVISRSSAFSFKGKTLGIPEIAERLHVAHILEGSVRTSGHQVRITAELIDARSDKHVWSETYDRELDNIFAIQDEIAAAVVAQLKLKLLGAAPRSEAKNPDAYALVLLGNQLRRLGTGEGTEKAIQAYQRALALSPDYAAAWEGLARSYISEAAARRRPMAEGVELARQAANRALRIDPNYAPTYARLSWIAMVYDADMTVAAERMQRALMLSPTDVDIIASAANLVHVLGRQAEAIALRSYVVAHDPLNPASHGNLSFSYYSAERWDDAIAAARAALTLSPDFAGAHALIAISLLRKGEPEAALAEMKREAAGAERQSGLAIVHHALGRRAESDAALSDLVATVGPDSDVLLAQVLACRGEVDRAFEVLDQLLKQRGRLDAIHLEPKLANLHGDPRWPALLEKLGVSKRQLDAIRLDVTLPK